MDTCISCGEGFNDLQPKEEMMAYVNDTPNVIHLDDKPQFIGWIHSFCVSTYETKLRARS